MLNLDKFYELMKEREVANLNQLSMETGLPYTTISYMLTGHDMYVGNLVELAKFFNVPVDYMINKPYRIAVYTEDTVEYVDSSSLIETLVSTRL